MDAKPIFESKSLGASQIEAIKNTSENRISMITGGPGTGKTTIAKIISDCHNSVIGLSPTGKGASRLAESIGCQCYTIHRATHAANIGELDFSDFDLIVIDESGMLGIDVLEMLLTLIYASKSNARIVFLGDSGQLPSISPGKVLDELALCIPSSKLNVTYRFSDADIGSACDAARIGHLHDTGDSSYYSLNIGGDELAWKEYARIRNICGTQDTRLITFHREHSFMFNQLAKSRINDDPPVVCIQNNYRENTFNGQCGYLSKSGKLVFGSNIILPTKINWRFAYGSTCHTAQGGQWKGVVVWVPSARYVTKEWLLTALSRAVSHLSVVVRDAAMTESCLVASKPASKRISLLSAFVKGEASWEQSRT